MTRRSDSSSSRSPSAVKPTMSANTTVTVRRDSCDAGGTTAGAIELPHSWQKLARCGFGSPQAGQLISIANGRSCTRPHDRSSAIGHAEASAAGGQRTGRAEELHAVRGGERYERRLLILG